MVQEPLGMNEALGPCSTPQSRASTEAAAAAGVLLLRARVEGPVMLRLLRLLLPAVRYKRYLLPLESCCNGAAGAGAQRQYFGHSVAPFRRGSSISLPRVLALDAHANDMLRLHCLASWIRELRLIVIIGVMQSLWQPAILPCIIVALAPTSLY